MTRSLRTELESLLASPGSKSPWGIVQVRRGALEQALEQLEKLDELQAHVHRALCQARVLEQDGKNLRELLERYPEELFEELEAFAQHLSPEHAAQLRAIVMRAKGEL